MLFVLFAYTASAGEYTAAWDGCDRCGVAQPKGTHPWKLLEDQRPNSRVSAIDRAKCDSRDARETVKKILESGPLELWVRDY